MSRICLVNGVHMNEEAASECPLIPGRSKQQKLENWRPQQAAAAK